MMKSDTANPAVSLGSLAVRLESRRAIVARMAIGFEEISPAVRQQDNAVMQIPANGISSLAVWLASLLTFDYGSSCQGGEFVESRSRMQLQFEHLCLAFAKGEPRRQRLNPIKEFGVVLLDEVHCVREIFPGREPTYLEPSILI